MDFSQSWESIARLKRAHECSQLVGLQALKLDDVIGLGRGTFSREILDDTNEITIKLIFIASRLSSRIDACRIGKAGYFEL